MAISREMSVNDASRQRSKGRRGMAFFIEALVVLAFLMISLAVFVKLFSSSQLEARNANRKSEAVQLATNCAEVFSASPTTTPSTSELDGLVATCTVTPTKQASGTLFEATIVVRDGDAEVYKLDTSRYVSNRGGAA